MKGKAMSNEHRAEGHLSRRRLVQFAALGTVAATAVAGSAGAGMAQTAAAGNTLEKVRKSGKLRVAAPVGAPPYFMKDLASGELSGACVEMAKDIAKILGVEAEFIDSTWGDQIIQLQTDKVDIGMASSITPTRALSVGFTAPYFEQSYGIIAAPSLNASTWADLNKPEVRIAVDLGSTQETSARRYAPNASITAHTSPNEVMLALQSNRADCAVFGAIPGLTAVAKNPSIGRYLGIGGPVVSIPTALVIPLEESSEWKDFLNAWVAYNRSSRQTEAWLVEGLELSGVDRKNIPADVSF